jgi:aryl-alcohol dehydrogenase-like predicted oxidoreductase/enamine deaminase RidA (YjgF/YER057c/UK114 family)
MIPRLALSPTLSISRVLTGLWQVADMERDGRAVDWDTMAAAMEPYAAAGLTTFDMADHYGSAEDVVGRYRQRPGARPVELLTKWVPEPGPITREAVRTAVQRSLDRMQLDQLPLLQFHAWQYANPAWLDALFWLTELRAEGLVANLGLTNFDTAHLRIALTSGIPVVSNQVCFSLLDQRAAGAMTELCLAHGVKLLAFGTVAGGLLSERWLGQPDPASLETWSQMKYRRFVAEAGGWEALQRLLRVLADVAGRHGVSIANVACRYMMEQPAVGGIIIGARLGESAHVDETVRLATFALDDASRAEIATVVQSLRAIPGDCGDEYRKPPFLTASGDLSHHLETFPAPYTTERRQGRTVALSGTPWEEIAGFARAVRVGDRILVSGTTATHGNRALGTSDPAAQMHAIIDKVEGAILSLGGTLDDVVRTRVYVRDATQWEPISRAHGERFRGIQPANTLVHAPPIGDEYLVEMDAEAIIGSPPLAP